MNAVTVTVNSLQLEKVISDYIYIKSYIMAMLLTMEKAKLVQELKDDIAKYLKEKYNLHLIHNEIGEMYIPEINCPVEFTLDKERDNKYQKDGWLPMVFSDKLEMDYKMYIDIFLDFHKKWRELNKKHDNPYPWWSQD